MIQADAIRERTRAEAAIGSRTIAERLQALDWSSLGESLRERGYARTGPLLTPDECASLIALYPEDRLFRSRVEMARHRFGVGDYKYFAYPLPALVEDLRVAAYPALAAVANRWAGSLRSPERFPERLDEYLARSAAAGQTRPTPLLLHYEAGGYNCLHQDLYGPLAFPLQVACFLSEPGRDYTGGEFLLVEQRPRAQSVGHAMQADRGELVIFTTRTRPASGVRGTYRVNVRHGVSRVHSGSRYTLGVIFHDAS